MKTSTKQRRKADLNVSKDTYKAYGSTQNVIRSARRNADVSVVSVTTLHMAANCTTLKTLHDLEDSHQTRLRRNICASSLAVLQLLGRHVVAVQAKLRQPNVLLHIDEHSGPALPVCKRLELHEDACVAFGASTATLSRKLYRRCRPLWGAQQAYAMHGCPTKCVWTMWSLVGIAGVCRMPWVTA